MTVSITQGRYDRIPTVILPTSTETWADKSSWSSWTNWTAPANDIVVVITDDLGSVSERLATIELDFEGTLVLELKIADTVDGGGVLQSPTTYSFVEGVEETLVAGRYYQWTITIEPNSEVTVPRLTAWQQAYDTEPEYSVLSTVDTSTLTGTITARNIDTDLTLVKSLQITAHDQTTWVDRYYALPDDYTTPTTTGAQAVILSKSPPQIRMESALNEAVDAVVDITITGFRSVTVTDRGLQRT